MGDRHTDQHRYTHGHHESVLRSHRWRTAANSAAYLLPSLHAGQDLLDVGCGPGNLTVDLARHVGSGLVVGVDNAAEAIESARSGNEGRSDVEVRFEIGDTYGLEFPDGSFDVVHAHQMLQHLSDPVAALVEMGRVCRSGGLVAARDGDYPAMAWYPSDPWLDTWLDVYCQIAVANGGEPAAGRRLMGWAQEAGFEHVTSSASAWCFADAGQRSWWGGLWADRMTESALAPRAVELGLAGGDDLQEMAAAWHRWAEHPDGWFAVLHGEILCRKDV